MRIQSWSDTLEGFSSLTVDPRWLIYLPPDTATLQREAPNGAVEDLNEIFRYYRNEGIDDLLVRRLERGPRVVAIVCKDAESGERRFGVRSVGCLYTRRGRPVVEADLVERLSDGLSKARVWERLKSEWVCLEGELLPWTTKGETILEEEKELFQAGERMYEAAEELLKGNSRIAAGRECFRKFRNVVERYASEKTQPVAFVPFHLIASERRVFFERSRLWHAQILGEISEQAGAPFRKASYRYVSLKRVESVKSCLAWCDAMSSFVISPFAFIPHGRRGLAQPAFLYRGPEFLRLVHGPEYDLIENRARIRGPQREGNRRILKQLALGIEAASRFVSREPLSEVESVVRAVLAVS